MSLISIDNINIDQIMSNTGKQTGKDFLMKWTLFTSISFFIGFMFSLGLGYIFASFVPDLVNLLFGLVIGLTVGYIQWFFLKERIPVSNFWGMASLIGLGIPFLIAVILDKLGMRVTISDNHPYSYVVAFAAGGFFSALLQLNLLKSYSSKSGWWLVVSFIAWGAGTGLVFLVNIGTTIILRLITGGLLIGIITGSGLIRIIKKQDQIN